MPFSRPCWPGITSPRAWTSPGSCAPPGAWPHAAIRARRRTRRSCNDEPDTPPQAVVRGRGARGFDRGRGADRDGVAAQRRLPLHACRDPRWPRRRCRRFRPVAVPPGGHGRRRLLPPRTRLDGSAVPGHRRRCGNAGGVFGHPPRPVPREPGRGRDRPHAQRRRVRGRTGPGQARRDLRAQGSRRQDGARPQEVRRRNAGTSRGQSLVLPELGHVALLLALLFSALQGIAGLAGAHRGNASWMAVTRPAALAQLVLVLIAYLALTVAFVLQDFSVKYVADNSNSLLPLVYRYTAVWGAHEG